MSSKLPPYLFALGSAFVIAPSAMTANKVAAINSGGTAWTSFDLGTLAPLASPTLTGTPAAPTASAGTNTTQLATTAFVTSAVTTAVTGLLNFKGTTDCSANPNYPAGVKGDSYIVSVAGKIGGASGTSVDIGDWYVCEANNAGGTEASVGASWGHMEHNLVGALLASNNLSDVASASSAINNILPSQTSNSGKYLTTNGTAASWGTVTVPTAANPTASLGLAAVPGSAATFMRSDGAPSLDVTIAPTMSGAWIFSAAGAASAPAIKASGAPFAGTGTTSFPLVYLNNSSATASTTLSTSGTAFGINSHGSPDLANWMLDGSSKFKVDNSGALTVSGNVSAGGSSTLSGFGCNVNTVYNISATLNVQNSAFIGATAITAVALGTITCTNISGASAILKINPTYNQASGSAANTDLLVNRTETAIGSGGQLLLDLQRGGVSQFNVDRLGNLTTLGTAIIFGTLPTTGSPSGSLETITVATIADLVGKKIVFQV